MIRFSCAAIYLGDIKAAAAADLEQVRQMVNKMQDERNAESDTVSKLSSDWCFVDCKYNGAKFELNLKAYAHHFFFFAACTAERFFRIDRAQEHLHYLTDIAHEALFVLNTMAQTPDEDGPFPTLGQSPELR